MELFFVFLTQAQTGFSDMYAVNSMTPLFFFPEKVIFQFILVNIFLTLIIKEYDKIRKQK